ncbi:hypothetical protein WDW89_24545 [Deltaproteobacteria bacterium TL4]
MTTALKSLGISPSAVKEDRFKLSSEVDAILDRSVGLEAYTRNDTLRENVFKHFKLSLEHMVVLARSVGAQVILVTPASNLKDCSPFKSQDTTGIKKADLERSGELMMMSTPLVWDKEWEMVLHFLDQAVKLNPRLAELRYRRGQALLALGRFEKAKIELISARDEDVCPLRALTPIVQMVGEVTKAQQVLLVDFEGLMEQRMLSLKRHTIPGEEYFLDHVHLTIEGHKLLAVALLEAMSKQGLVHPDPHWDKEGLAAVSAKIEGGVNPEKQGQALANLARVLLWAGKDEDAARLARLALDIGGDYEMPYYDRAHMLFGIDMAERGRPRIAYSSLMEAIRLNPNNVQALRKLEQIRPLLVGHELNPLPPQIQLDRYPSMTLRKLVQGRLNSRGLFVPDGIEAEFHENGRLQRFLDIDQGKPKGLEMTWDQDGKESHRNNLPICL